MSAPTIVRAFELDLAPEDELRAVHATLATEIGGWLPGDDPVPLDAWVADEHKLDAFLDMVRFVAYDAATGDAVGYARVELDRHTNTHVAWAFVAVAESHRRRGVGTALLREVAEAGADDHFLATSGLTRRQTAHQNRLRVADVDVAMLHDWIARAPERAGGYSLRAWDGPTPDELVEAFAACTEVMNSAPRGDLDLADERMTPDRLRTIESARTAAGTSWWTICAVEDATGAFAGFTQLSFPAWRTKLAKQNDTGVDPAHRERGLGRWLKAAMLLRLLDERPEIEQVETWNAGSNAPMLAINHALGFRLARVTGNWQADLDVVRKQLEARP